MSVRIMLVGDWPPVSGTARHGATTAGSDEGEIPWHCPVGEGGEPWVPSPGVEPEP
ncbi:hypothetical protein [Prauserella sp. PE36]|uniref:hypothetical protein n=1 Tax=Prauserella sp. PE36 TaxID=1504709 RepID=UPI001314CF04|nr:hypothetical protein [Prauserella sp. PE36]